MIGGLTVVKVDISQVKRVNSLKPFDNLLKIISSDKTERVKKNSCLEEEKLETKLFYFLSATTADLGH